MGLVEGNSTGGGGFSMVSLKLWENKFELFWIKPCVFFFVSR